MTRSSNTHRPAGIAQRGAGGRTGRSLLALSAALLVGSTVHALAQTPPPAVDHVWGGCILSETAVIELQNSITAGTGAEGADVDFVVVYSRANSNDGQFLGGGGVTGPVICINDDQVGITAFEADEGILTEASRIPTDTHQLVPGEPDEDEPTSVNLLAAEEVFILQYELLDGEEDAGDIEKRICHTVAGNGDCFRIFPLPPPVIE